MSFVSHSARTVTVSNDNNDNNDNYSNSDTTATTTDGAEANNNNDNTTNGSASTAAVVLRLASGDSNSRKRGRSPTAAAVAGSSSRSGGVRRGILKRQRTASYIVGEPPLPAYVPAPVPEIIANVEDATIPGRSSATRTLPMRRGTPSIGAGRPFAGRRRSSTMLPRRWSGPRSMRCSRTSGGTSG